MIAAMVTSVEASIVVMLVDVMVSSLKGVVVSNVKGVVVCGVGGNGAATTREKPSTRRLRLRSEVDQRPHILLVSTQCLHFTVPYLVIRGLGSSLSPINYEHE